NSTQQGKAPEFPPAKSMAMDFSIFASGQSDSSAAGNHDNYEAAASSISTVQTMMSRNVNLTLDLLEQADTAKAEEIGDTKWQWQFTNEENEEQVGRAIIRKFRLVAERQSDDQLQWDLFLSSPVLQSNGEKHYLSGTSNNAVTEGIWTYYGFGRAGQTSQAWATLDWEMDNDKNVEIELEILANSSFSGSKIDYSTEGPVRIIVLNNSTEDADVTIKFNSETKAGFIKSPNYNNGNKACWNGDFENVDCSEVTL